MTNLIEYFSSQQASSERYESSFTYNTNGKVKPSEDIGVLLPSKIFASPIEYAKDLKQDVVNIGRAFKGKSNDHELGRINDVAMKIGALSLASYLYVRNGNIKDPSKVKQVMEFIGVGTFFGGMALWPKLTIQAPLKARTGVDIHQKYIDSQGRKKMLHQDPQYVLTDLYTREDLDKMGEKLDVNEKLPDRDNFIKQRAQKTAIQGNTLWMATAGFATPLISAVSCNALTQPVTDLMVKADILSSNSVMNNGQLGLIDSLKQRIRQGSLNKQFLKFLENHKNEKINDDLIDKFTSILFDKSNISSLEKDGIKNELTALSQNTSIDEDFVRNALQKIGKNLPTLDDAQNQLLQDAIKNNSFESISKILTKAINGKDRNLQQEIKTALETYGQNNGKVLLGAKKNEVKKLYNALVEYLNNNAVLTKYVDRVASIADNYNANQSVKMSKSFLKALNLNPSDLKKLSEGDNQILLGKLKDITSAENSANYDKLVQKLVKMIDDMEGVIGDDFFNQVKTKANEIGDKANKTFLEKGFKDFAAKFVKDADGLSDAGTITNEVINNTKDSALGIKSCGYRLLSILEIYKKTQNGSLKSQLEKILQAEGAVYDDGVLKDLVDICENIFLEATSSDFSEKLMTGGYNLSEPQYKAVMSVLTGESEDSVLQKLNSFSKYKKQYKSKIHDWVNSITDQLGERSGVGKSVSSAKDRETILGEAIDKMSIERAKQIYNSNKWLKIFGGTLIALTAITLIVGLTFGRKGKIEKQEENKVNG